jgi:hypothetical protein
MTVDQKAAQFQRKYGVWGSHDDYPREDWQREAYENKTSLSYWTWVATRMEVRGELREDNIQYTVSGFYTDTQQHFSHHVEAGSPEGAVRQTFQELSGRDISKTESLGELAEELEMEPVSVTRDHHTELVGQANPAW